MTQKLLTKMTEDDKMYLGAVLENLHEHAMYLQEDIKLSSTRMEHVRVTARANEAIALLNSLRTFVENDIQEDGTSL